MPSPSHRQVELFDPLQGSTAAFWDWAVTRLRVAKVSARGPEAFPLLPFQAALLRYHAGLGAELVDRSDTGETGVVITAHGIPENFSAVRRLVADAPTLTGYSFSALRPPHPAPACIRVADQTLELEEVLCRCTRRHLRVDLDVVLPVGDRVDKQDLAAPGFALLDMVLGEEAVATSLGRVRFRVALPSDPLGDWFPLPQLPERLAVLA